MNQNIIVLGGGTAGWMAANLIHHHLSDKGFTITLIESPDIGIIGVGEGSTPHLKSFFDTLQIDEERWMPACNATYKNGIRFEHWIAPVNPLPLNTPTHYFHPFASQIDRQTAAGFLINCHLRRQGHDADTHPDTFFLSAYLAEHQRLPKPKPNNGLALNYGYHFDAGLLGEFLKQEAIARGVRYVSANIAQVKTHLSGALSSLVDTEGQQYSADWFVDCSGFSSLLLQQTLHVPFDKFEHNLFNDRAVAMPSQASTPSATQTTAHAMPNGWRWDIPLVNRTGNGYVYSSQYIDKDKAEYQLRHSLGMLDADVPVKHLNMKVGRCQQHWVKNCLGVGLSQGFIEPLEATALHLVQYTIETFISAFIAGQFSTQHSNEFNALINRRFDGIRDYIVCHYKINNRNDTHYWRDNQQIETSASLSSILDVWDKGGDLTKEINQQQIADIYPAISWHCLLSGYHRFGPLGANTPASHQVDTSEIQQYIKQWAKGFRQQ